MDNQITKVDTIKALISTITSAKSPNPSELKLLLQSILELLTLIQENQDSSEQPTSDQSSKSNGQNMTQVRLSSMTRTEIRISQFSSPAKVPYTH